MRYLLLSTCLFLSVLAHGQSKQEKSGLTPPTIYTYVEQLPEPDYDISKYLSEHLNYPDSAANNNIQGRVILKFIVNEDGSTSDFQILKSLGGGCNEEATRVLSTMPKWKPGMHNGLPVKVWFTLPITFTLTENEKIYDVFKDHLDKMPKSDSNNDQYFIEHIQLPDSVRNNNIRGDIAVSVVINKDGSIGDCKIRRGLCKACDEEALRVVKNMPRWQAGIKAGQPVNSLDFVIVPFFAKISDRVYTYVEQMPVFCCDLKKYLKENIHYPAIARMKNIEGRVIVKFVVNEDGSITDCTIVTRIGRGCDEEALRVIKNMPAWKPGKMNGKPVKVYFTLPIVFKLTD